MILETLNYVNILILHTQLLTMAKFINVKIKLFEF